MRYFTLFLGLMNLMLPISVYAQTTVSGRVIFEGTAPVVEKVEVKSDTATCGTSQEIQKLILGRDKGVANAVVRVIGAQGVLPNQKGSLDQVSCEFQPHIQVIPAGGKLTLTSSDPVLHNAHAFYEDGSTAFNIAVPMAGMEVSTQLKKPGLIKLRCDAGHTWMSAYILVTEEPFFAMTDTDGNFKIEGVPAGNYEIEVWQEWLGSHREPLVVKEGEPASLTIPLKK